MAMVAKVWSILVRSRQQGGEWNVWGVVGRYAGILQGFFSMEVLPILLGELCIEQIHIAPTKVYGSNLFIISINH